MMSFFKKQADKKWENPLTYNEKIIPDTVKLRVERALGYDTRLVMPTIERAYKVLSCYPASLRHHDSDVGGLWEHSFEVALKCVESISKYTSDKKYVVLAFLAGLLHDVGKIAFYSIDTKGYDFNPLSLQGHPYSITGKKDEPDNAHATTSAMLLFSFLSDDIKNYPVLMLNHMFDAVLLHHKSLKGNNPILLALKDSDTQDAQEKIDAIIMPDTVKITNEDTNKPASAVKAEPKPAIQPEPVNNLVDIWIECLRHKIFNEFQNNYNFYVLEHEGSKILLIVSPASFNAVTELFSARTGKDFSPNVIAEMLYKNKFLAKKEDRDFIKVSLGVKKEDGHITKRDLTFVCLHADRVLTVEEIDKLMSDNRIVSVKIKL